MNGNDQPPPDESTAERLGRVEARLARLEDYLRLDDGAAGPKAAPEVVRRKEDELELVVGQSWFAAIGIGVLVLGGAFALSLPYPGLPAAAPSLIGYAGAAGLFILAGAWRRSFELVSGNLRAAAMALLYFATLRLCFFGDRHALDAAAAPGQALLVLAVALNLALALRWRSPWLSGFALATGYVTALAVGSAWFVLFAATALAAVAAAIGRRRRWPGFPLAGIALTYATYFLWAIGDPLLGRPLAIAGEPRAALGFLLACAAIFALGPRRNRGGREESAIDNLCALFNCAACYGLFLLHGLASFSPIIVAANGGAFVVFLSLAIAFWVRERSRVATFLYAMTGYMALTVAIVGASAVPRVFIWLSLQSVVVVATAIWFKSRLIVVANFLIYAAIVVAYVAVARVETGISVAFGLVALGTARLLNWQRGRLELKTELMRNVYLFSALVVFPYALYHLVPPAFVALAWTAAALFYYGMNLVVRNQKYRWMGHATLLFTALYLVALGTGRLDPLYRILSFVALGTVLVAVSLVFTKLRSRNPSRAGTDRGAGIK
jgi:hypothetical protein